MEWPASLKKTKQRKLVWEVLERAEQPLTAMDIAAELDRRESPVWLSTVYRVLDSFSEQGMVVKTGGLEGGMALYESSLAGHRHYAVCVECNRVTPLEGCPLEHLSPRVREADFRITGHRLQIYGYCANCRHKEKNEDLDPTAIKD